MRMLLLGEGVQIVPGTTTHTTNGTRGKNAITASGTHTKKGRQRFLMSISRVVQQPTQTTGCWKLQNLFSKLEKTPSNLYSSLQQKASENIRQYNRYTQGGYYYNAEWLMH